MRATGDRDGQTHRLGAYEVVFGTLPHPLISEEQLVSSPLNWTFAMRQHRTLYD
ncbi:MULTISPECIES: hypothetical protein [unclassified Streptomyces]|uniref:hypothetical protein n=1 Tax=unclassified Streptomyces TaxID=2593676 RepID=UPI00324E157A